MKNCITTLVSDDHFQYFIPMFVCSAKKFHPKADVRIFVKGKLKPQIKEYCPDNVVEDMFPEQKGNFNINALRFLIGREHFPGNKYVYFTDIDFIFLYHKKSLFKYFIGQIKKSDSYYAGLKSLGKRPRIVAGSFMATQKWLKAVDIFRERYLERLKKSAERRFDEGMLHDLCAKAGFLTPKTYYHFLSNEGYDYSYRDIHVGDFKFPKRIRNRKKMNKLIPAKNRPKIKKLLKDEAFREAVKIAKGSNVVSDMVSKLKQFLKRR